MADDKDNGGNGADDQASSSDFDAQIKALQAKKDAAAKREAAKREAMGEDEFVGTKPNEPGKFDGEVREPGWRWDRSANDWLEHRGTDFSKRSRASMPHGFEHRGDGSPTSPHVVVQRPAWQ